MERSDPPYVVIDATHIGLSSTAHNCEAYTRTLPEGRFLVVFDLETNRVRQEWKPGQWTQATLYYDDRPVATFTASRCLFTKQPNSCRELYPFRERPWCAACTGM